MTIVETTCGPYNTLMKIIVWDPKFETGNAEIDEQHRTLVRIINCLIEAAQVSKTGTKAIVGSNLDTLLEYTIFHFDYEELLMKKMGYTERELHIQHHNSFKTMIVGLYKRNQAGEDILEELIDFLNTWVTEHIQHSDKCLGSL